MATTQKIPTEIWDEEVQALRPIGEVLGYEPLEALSKDLKKASLTLSKKEARFLVNHFYTMQEDRIRSMNQVRALSKSKEPHLTLGWLANNSKALENSIAKALDVYSMSLLPGKWARSICGIGPVIAAGLLAHIDLEPWRCALSAESLKNKPCTPEKPHGPLCMLNPTVTAGQLWRYAGQDPTSVWEKGQKRPWNGDLRLLVWKLGESFVKVQNNEKDIYGHLFAQRKLREQERNFSGLYVDQAKEKLVKFNMSKEKSGYAWYAGCLTPEQGQLITEADPDDREGLTKALAGKPGSGLQMLSIGHIHSRARRYAAKIFLSHYQAVAYRDHFGIDPPKPYILTKEGGHAHEIKCPNWPWKEGVN